MRIKCSVDVHNRACAVAGVATVCKPTHAQVSIGKKPGSDQELFLMIATTKDLNGRKFVLKENVSRVFVKFVEDGKATIQLKEPTFDLRISKADPSKLKLFLNALKLAHEGRPLDKENISMLAPASTKSVEKPTEKLCVRHRKDYPVTRGFPSSLTTLEIQGCKLTRVDRRILELKHLRFLDLSDNALKQLPPDCGQLTQLRELRLERNQLSEFPAGLCQGPWIKCLKVLNLTGNRLEGCSLPLQFGELVNLVNLVVDDNSLTALPPTVGNLSLLRRLSVAKNKLKMLPASFLRLRLENLDISDNEFVDLSLVRRTGEPPASRTVPNLLEICGNAILQKGIPFNPEIIPRNLCWYLQYFSKRCFCGQFCFESSLRATAPLDPHFVANTCSNTTDRNAGRIPVLAFLCSSRCYEKFYKNPMVFSI